MSKRILIEKHIRAIIKGKGCILTREFMERLDEVVRGKILESCDRARGNRRMRLKGRDL